MAQGTIKWFNRKKGFGFIMGEAGEDVFVHFTQVQGPGTKLQEGDHVEYEVVSGEKGPKASQVVKKDISP